MDPKDFLERIARFSPKQLALLALELQQKVERLSTPAALPPIAVVGMACRVPGGAETPEDFWRLVLAGTDAVTEVPKDRWDIDALYDPNPDAPGKMSTRWGGFLRDVDKFDANFFGISPREALNMDPQQRLALEVAWEALERAGCAPDGLEGSRTGVFLGVRHGDYSQLNLGGGDLTQIDSYLAAGTAACVASGRISYLLGLRGPSISVDTACSSSLVAVHLACQSLRAGESTLALAGGVNNILTPEVTMALSRSRMMAADGRCKAFDARADGFVRSEGCGFVVLKRLADAQADGDTIFGVIRASVVNQDGRSSGLTAPSGPAQEALIRDALALAGLQPADIHYVEAHGTGTALGDPIEIQALDAALRAGRPPEAPLWVGSVKTNIGHMESAAGIGGLIKALLALRAGVIPGNLHLQRPNPHIDWAGLALSIPTSNIPWPSRGVRRAGVSSFGFSGTNSHVILEEAPAASARVIPEIADARPYVLPLAARNDTALRELAGRFARHFETLAEADVADSVLTAGAGRAHFESRVAVVAHDRADLVTKLRAASAATAVPGLARGYVTSIPRAAFLFTGQGSQWVGMGRELYASEPVFRAIVDRCAQALEGELDRDLRQVMFEDSGGLLDRTRYTQPALFALEVGIAELWRSWGVEPALVLGHSVGEYAAACFAGVLVLEDGVRLIAARARAMQALPGDGAMLSVQAGGQDPAVLLESIDRELREHRAQVSLAARNAPDSVVLAGERLALNLLAPKFTARGFVTRMLSVSHGFHSPQMDPMLDEFERRAQEVTHQPPRHIWVSNLTGGALDWSAWSGNMAHYWRQHAREPVQFESGIRTAGALGATVFVEVGPHSVLSALGRATLPQPNLKWLPSLQRSRDDWEVLARSVGEFYVSGGRLDWVGFNRPHARRSVNLPTYPFQRRRYWVTRAANTVAHGDSPIHDLLYQVSWEATDTPVADVGAARGSWIVLDDALGTGAALVAGLEDIGAQVVRVLPGVDYQATSGTLTIDPVNPDHYDRLLKSTESVRGVVSLWGLRVPVLTANTVPSDTQSLGADAALLLAQSCARQATVAAAPRLYLVTRGAQRVRPEDQVSANQAPLWGLGKVMALEHPELQATLIDLDPAQSGATPGLLAALFAAPNEAQLALRAAGSLLKARLVRLPRETAGVAHTVRSEATYLVTGGLSGLGLLAARWLVTQGARQLVLVGRRPPTDATRGVLDALRSQGASVAVLSADVSTQDGVDRIAAAVSAGGFPLKGVIHCAGVLDDGLIAQQTPAKFATVLAPKADGAWRLHRYSSAPGMDLDFFVLFSSLSAVMGSPGQANYAAANTFLDVLAYERRSRGLPALSVGWGAWEETGMAVRTGAIDRGAVLGVGSIHPTVGFEVLDSLLSLDVTHVVVAAIDWQQARKQLAASRGASFAADLLQGSEVGSAAAALRAALRSADGEARLAAITAVVHQSIGMVLGFSPEAEDLGAERSFASLGVDSLTAMELRNTLQVATGLTFKATLAFDYPTPARLVTHLDELLARQVRAVPADEREEVTL